MSFLKGLTGEKILPWIDVKADHGAIGDNVADDTSAISAAISAANSLAQQNARGAIVFIPPGNYKITGALTTITQNGVKIIGTGGCFPGGGSGFYCSGSADVFTANGFFGGATTVIKDIVISGIRIDASGKNKAGTIVTTNAVNGFILDNFYVVNYGNGMLNTLTSNMLLREVDFQWAQALNGFAWKMQGTGNSINGYEDKVENVEAYNVNVTTRYFKGDLPGGANDNTIDIVSCLGAVNNIYLDTVTFLKGRHGLVLDHYDGSTGPVPRNIVAKNSDFEYNYGKGINARAVNSLQFDNIYSHGSGFERGMDFGPKANNIKITASSCHDHWLQGIVFEGKGMTLTATDVYWNSQNNSSGVYASTNTHSGIYVTGQDFTMLGGTSGINPQRPSNSFKHAYGIDNAGSGRVQAIGVRLNGNYLGATNGTVTSLGNITT